MSLDHEKTTGVSDESYDDAPPAALAGENFDPSAVFPRVKERDPYRRLGINAEASYEEVQDARNYLVDTYRGHSAGVESIEAAFDRIIQDKLNTRKKAKGLRMMRKKQSQDPNYVPPFLERLKSRFEKPDDQTIMRRGIIYAIMAGWAIVQSASSGPAFQMAISFGLTVYFLHEKRGKNKELLGRRSSTRSWRSSLDGSSDRSSRCTSPSSPARGGRSSSYRSSRSSRSSCSRRS